jgi:cytosine/adenosine deaminase-related metal-dependent hydrolase
MSLSSAATQRAFRGTFLHAPERGRLECLDDALIVVAADGAISAVYDGKSVAARAEAERLAQGQNLVTLGPKHYVLPGMVDLHVHAPQWPQLGEALDLPLEDWLQTFTFPLEARYSDTAFAMRVYESLVSNLLANGTTTAMYFAPLHLEATKALADICLHCSESDWQHQYVLKRYGCTDTAALDSFGLLSRRTILAHGNFIDDADTAAIRERGAGIAHCPLSNVYFSDAVFPLRRILDAGVHVGIGTDVAGGASPSVLENARHAIISSRLLETGVDPRQNRAERRRPHSRIDALTAFWLATSGGGIALDLPVGQFAPGYQFDACVIDAAAPHSNLHVEADDSAQTVLQKIIYGAARANISQVWVANRQVVGH